MVIRGWTIHNICYFVILLLLSNIVELKAAIVMLNSCNNCLPLNVHKCFS